MSFEKNEMKNMSLTRIVAYLIFNFGAGLLLSALVFFLLVVVPAGLIFEYDVPTQKGWNHLLYIIGAFVFLASRIKDDNEFSL